MLVDSSVCYCIQKYNVKVEHGNISIYIYIYIDKSYFFAQYVMTTKKRNYNKVLPISKLHRCNKLVV